MLELGVPVVILELGRRLYTVSGDVLFRKGFAVGLKKYCTLSLGFHFQFSLHDPNIFFAQPLPTQHVIPIRLRLVMRPVIAWCIWKERCCHVKEEIKLLTWAVIGKSRNRLEVYIKQFW